MKKRKTSLWVRFSNIIFNRVFVNVKEDEHKNIIDEIIYDLNKIKNLKKIKNDLSSKVSKIEDNLSRLLDLYNNDLDVKYNFKYVHSFKKASDNIKNDPLIIEELNKKNHRVVKIIEEEYLKN